MKLILVRHSELKANILGIYKRLVDYSLRKKGKNKLKL